MHGFPVEEGQGGFKIPQEIFEDVETAATVIVKFSEVQG